MKNDFFSTRLAYRFLHPFYRRFLFRVYVCDPFYISRIMSIKKSKQKTPLSSVNKLNRPELFSKKILEPALFCNSALTKLKTKINILDFLVLTNSPRVDEAESVGYDF